MWLILLMILCLFGAIADAADARFVEIQLSVQRGVDPRVDYAALRRFGPWDDRNYELTLEDLEWLASDEANFQEPIPAFARVLLRRDYPGLGNKSGQIYPRTALNIYRHRYGGYLINGALYQGVELSNNRFEVIAASAQGADSAAKLFNGERRITSPDGNAESAIAINPVDSNRLIAGSNGAGAGVDMHISSDRGSSWQLATPLSGNTCCDPTVGWSTDGLIGYASVMGGCSFATGCQIWFYRSLDFGQTWGQRVTLTPLAIPI